MSSPIENRPKLQLGEDGFDIPSNFKEAVYDFFEIASAKSKMDQTALDSNEYRVCLYYNPNGTPPFGMTLFKRWQKHNRIDLSYSQICSGWGYSKEAAYTKFISEFGIKIRSRID